MIKLTLELFDKDTNEKYHSQTLEFHSMNEVCVYIKKLQKKLTLVQSYVRYIVEVR